MTSKRLNLSDRKIVDTRGGALRDPSFRLPEVDIVGRGEGPSSPVGDTATPPPSAPPPSSEMGVPTSIRVESRDVRIQKDGSSVIDVVVSYLPAPGARQHEVRITKL